MQCDEWLVGARGRTQGSRTSGAWCRATLPFRSLPEAGVELQRSSPEMQPRVALLSCDLFKGLAAPALRGLGDLSFEGRNAVAGKGNEFPAITPGLVQHIDRITASRGVVQIELQIFPLAHGSDYPGFDEIGI
jgi:hypothetical protein